MKLPWTRERAELDREVAFHLEALADGFEKDGMSRAEALQRARKEFGGVEQVKEQCGDESRWAWVVQVLQDLQFGWRMMKKSPPVTIAAALSLALGIGATTAIYSFADAVLWRSMAVPAPEEMAEVYWTSKARPEGLLRGGSGSGFRDGDLGVADYFSRIAFDAMRSRSEGRLEVAAHIYPTHVSVSYGGNVSVSKVRGVSDNFFAMLRLQPWLGRLPDGTGDAPQIVVSHRFWERVLGRSEGAIGQLLRVNDFPYVIAAVLAPDFFGLVPGDDAELYTNIRQSPSLLTADSWYRTHANDPLAWWMQLIVRRDPGVSLTQAQEVLQTVFAGSWPASPKSPEQTPHIRLVDASTGLGGIRRDLGDPVKILFGLVLMVLIVACANIANLLLARATEREKETGLRVALGCSSGRLMRQFFTESFLLALMGGALSVGVALAVASLMSRVLPPGLLADSLMPGLDARLLAVTAVVTVVTAVFFGLYPAWRTSRTDAAPVIKEGSGSGGTLTRGRLLPARMLVLAQVALGVLLVTAAMLYTGHLSAIVNTDAGFERGHALLFDLRPGEVGYDEHRLERFYSEVEERLRAIPGVVAVGLSMTRPMMGGGFHETVRTPGSDRRVDSAVHQVRPGFVDALGVSLIAGRALSIEDLSAKRHVAIIDERLARELQLSSPVGAQVHLLDQQWEVIGLARNAAYSRLTYSHPVIYVPMHKPERAVSVVMRTAVSPMSVAGAAREAVRSLDSKLPLVDLFTMEQQISRTLQRERMFAWLCGSFGVLALVLCVVGLYGLMSHATARRKPEIGIRMALGATREQVLRQVVRDGMWLAMGGVLAGVPLAMWAAKIAERQRLLPAGPFPYWTLCAAIAALLISALLAVFGPALRAASLDPLRALRHG
jgi:predicted permease